MPATVRVPDDAVIEPVVAVIDEVEINPAAEKLVCAVMALSLIHI